MKEKRNIIKKAKGRFYQDVAFRSEKDDWETPYDLFELVNSYFEFECDVCADDKNALCDNYFTRDFSCLDYDWYCMNYMNPPYKRGMDKFIKRAYDQYFEEGNVTVALLPARTDTKWFHNYIYKSAEIIFIKGRVTFYNNEGKLPNSAPFPSMLVGWGVDPGTFSDLKNEINK